MSEEKPDEPKPEPREKRPGWVEHPPESGQWERTDDVEMRRREIRELEGYR